MKRWGFVLVILGAFLAGTVVPTVLSQSEESNYLVQVDYMKVTPGKLDEYLEVETEMWKPVHQERIKNGELVSWALYGRQFPYGTDTEYDYVTVNVYRSPEVFIKGTDYNALFSKVYPGKDVSQMLAKTDSSRRLVRGDVLYLVDRAE